MYYIVQEDVFREENYQLLIDGLERLGLEYEIVKVRPFVEELEYNTDRKDVFVFGSVKLARLAKQYDWVPGSLMYEGNQFDMLCSYGEHLLNADAHVYHITDSIEWYFDEMFIRPCADDKSFTGRVFNEKEWKEYKSTLIANGLSVDTLIQVAAPKKIYQERRYYVIGGKVVTGSQYKAGSRVVTSGTPDEIMEEFAQKMVDRFALAKAFVIDITRTPEGLKVVEAGCINCAGFYKCDLQKVLMALEKIEDWSS